MPYTFYQTSSLEKIMHNYKAPKKEFSSASALKNEKFSYQIAFRADRNPRQDIKISVKSDLKKFITIRLVGYVPGELLTWDGAVDDDFITFDSGMFPDPLYPLESDEIEASLTIFKGIWITVDLDGTEKAGVYPIEISFKNESLDITKTFNLEIIDADLPKQELKFTQWFHSDCIASAYNVPMFSADHWNMIEKFIKTASDNGINMILTPIFTPPLDTEVGGERPTVQLLKIEKCGNTYKFDFSRLKRWIDLCLKCGIEYFEMAHLFTQWGANFTPKIVAIVDGWEKKIFGWNVKADSSEYADFLSQLLPALCDFLKKEGIAENTYFHISDEPTNEHLASYRYAKELAEKYLDGFKIIDALSHYDFYKKGLVTKPIVATNAIQKFINKDIKNLWAYYCCCQQNKTSNRFLAMPSYRNRVIATQLYKFDIEGFLHWGYNFYYAEKSRYKIDPFRITDAGGGFPAGDSFSVYPYNDGPVESLRLVVFNEALQDLRAMKLLEKYIGKEKVVKLIEDIAKTDIKFENYPKGAEFVLCMREEINQHIKKHCKNV